MDRRNSDVKLVEEARLYPEDRGLRSGWTAEASSLEWPPGYWPVEVELTGSTAPPRRLQRTYISRLDGEVQFIDYATSEEARARGEFLRVYND